MMNRWQRFADELSQIDPVFEAAVNGFEGVLQSSDHAEQDDDALKGLEVEDTPQDGDVDMDHDDVLAQMEARLAKLSRVSLGSTYTRRCVI